MLVCPVAGGWSQGAKMAARNTPELSVLVFKIASQLQTRTQFGVNGTLPHGRGAIERVIRRMQAGELERLPLLRSRKRALALIVLTRFLRLTGSPLRRKTLCQPSARNGRVNKVSIASSTLV